MDKTRITVQAIVNADQKKVWECYTRPEHITGWNFAADSWHCPHAENDLIAGGRYLARMEAKDGSFGFDFEAVYDEISEYSSLSYTMTDGRKATVSLHPREKATEVSVTFDAENQNPAELQRAGWQAILDNFKKYTEGR